MSVPSAGAPVEEVIAATPSLFRAYLTLTKPRIMVLLLFTAYCAMLVANKGVPGIGRTVMALFGLALSCGGSAALNMWYDRDIDAIMNRTAKRPIPLGMIKPIQAFSFGLILELLSVLVLGIWVNWTAAWLSLGGSVYYVVVYTVWLKRRTPQNIVIGGGAGAFPPLVGWAAITGHLSWAALLMFAIIFFWTPPHFWALALFKNDDYVRARVPMMPVVRGARSTKWQILVYNIILLGSSVALYFTGDVGLVYVVVALVTGIAFLVYAIRLMLEDDTVMTWARKTFYYSLLYLPVLFIGMVVGIRH